MTVSLILTEQIVKLFIILMIGFIMVKIGLLKVSDSKSISVLLVYLVLPCMIVNSFQIEYTPEVLKGFIQTVVFWLFRWSKHFLAQSMLFIPAVFWLYR